MRRFLRSHWRALGLLLSIVLLGVAFWDVDLAELIRLVGASNLWLLTLVVFINLGVIGLKGLRWREIIGATQPLSWWAVTNATLIGYMTNAFLPARGGEVVRVLVLGRQERVSRAMLTGALVVDHIIEGASMVLILLTLPFLLSTPLWMRTATGVVTAITVGAAILVWLVVGVRRAQFVRWLPATWQPRIAAILDRVNDGLTTLRSAPRMLRVLGLAVVTWLVQAWMLALCLDATGLHLGFEQALFALMAINIGALIPGAPSSVGPFELAATVSLGFLGVAKTPALTVALLYHFIQVIPTVIAGLIALPLAGLRLGDLGASAEPQSPSSKSA